MFHARFLTNLIQKNEEWILSKVLGFAYSFKYTNTSIINYPWRQTIQDFIQVITQSGDSFAESIRENLNVITDNNIFQSLAKDETHKINEKSIPIHIYISVIKTIRNLILELIENFRIPDSEKKTYNDFLNKSFDSFEIACISGSNEIHDQNYFAESGKRLSIKHYKSVFEDLLIPVMLVNPVHKVVKYNKEASKAFPFLFTGKSKNLNGSIRFEGQDTLYSKINEFRETDEKESSFETRLHYNQQEGFYMINLRKIRNSEDILVCFFNLTKWKQLERNLTISKRKAEESDRLKTAFLANMSHEIRTPMNAIVGFAELLSMTRLSFEEKKEYLGLIKKSSSDLLVIIEDVIDIAKIESKQLKIISKDISLRELFNDLRKIYSEIIHKNYKGNLKIILRIPENEKNTTIKTDPKRLKQVLSNLINNAIKFTEDGYIEIGYKISENRHVYFFVKDSGIGIPYKMQKRVFERFLQVEDSFYKNTSGAGLGLTISKNIIKLLGGDIWVSSTPNKGTNFFFYLPYTPSENDKIIPEKTEIIRNKAFHYDFNKYCILIAEDDDTNFYYLNELLKRTGLKIIRAKTGLEAINIVEETEKIDIILMDIKMPEVNGIEAARFISHIKPNIPIIAQTAFAMDNDRQTCIEAGCTDYISKPLKLNTLMETIDRNIKKAEKLNIKNKT